jgi:hypothetical protein
MRKICYDKKGHRYKEKGKRKEERKSEEGRHEIGWILVWEKGSMKKRNRKTHTHSHTHAEREGEVTLRKKDRKEPMKTSYKEG